MRSENRSDPNHRHIVTIVTLFRGPATLFGPAGAAACAAHQNGTSFSSPEVANGASGALPA